jgi:hypothetical protein
LKAIVAVPRLPPGALLWRLRWAITVPRQVAIDIEEATPELGAALTFALGATTGLGAVVALAAFFDCG